MTITTTQPLRISGSVVAANTTATYDAALEADLVARGVARFVTGDPRLPNAPDEFSVVRGLGEPDYTYDVGASRLAENTSGTLTIPTYDGSGSVVHPSIVYLPRGFGRQRKRWWMAMTPYPSSQSAFENPSILVSDDGINWAVPAGLTNPIVGYPGGNDYNSDVFLFLDVDAQTLVCVYRQTGGNNTLEQLFYTRSYDGVVWSRPQLMMQYPAAEKSLISPSIWWDGTQYVCLAHDNQQANNPMVRMTAASLNGPWSAPSNITVTLPVGETQTWHSDFRRLPASGHVVGVVQSGTNSGGKLYAAISTDNGLTVRHGPLLHSRPTTSSIYKCGFAPLPGEWATIIGYLNAPNFGLEFGRIKFDRDAYNRERAAFLAAGAQATLPAVSPYLLWDSFSRANTTSALGTATSGQSWTVEAGTLGIVDNKAYAPGAGNNKSHIALTADIDARMNWDTISTGGYLTFRRVDASNFWRMTIFSGTVQLQVIVSGNVAQSWNVTQTVTNGDEMRVRARGNSIQVYQNGMLVIDIYDGRHATATGVGLQISETTTRVSNLLVARA